MVHDLRHLQVVLPEAFAGDNFRLRPSRSNRSDILCNSSAAVAPWWFFAQGARRSWRPRLRSEALRKN